MPELEKQINQAQLLVQLSISMPFGFYYSLWVNQTARMEYHHQNHR